VSVISFFFLRESISPFSFTAKCSFQGLNPFPSKAIFPKRDKYVLMLEEEMAETEKQRTVMEANMRRKRTESIRNL